MSGLVALFTSFSRAQAPKKAEGFRGVWGVINVLFRRWRLLSHFFYPDVRKFMLFSLYAVSKSRRAA